MSIKTIALAAATVAATASAASATSYFQYGETVEKGSVLELGLVRADMAGVVEIYDYNNGELGTLLGTEMVNAGANSDVRVNVIYPPLNDVIAVLKIDDQIVATRDYELAN